MKGKSRTTSRTEASRDDTSTMECKRIEKTTASYPQALRESATTTTTEDLAAIPTTEVDAETKIGIEAATLVEVVAILPTTAEEEYEEEVAEAAVVVEAVAVAATVIIGDEGGAYIDHLTTCRTLDETAAKGADTRAFSRIMTTALLVPVDRDMMRRFRYWEA